MERQGECRMGKRKACTCKSKGWYHEYDCPQWGQTY